MTRINADDLPAHVREQLGLPPRANKRPSGRAVTGGGAWRCPRCPQLGVLTTWAAVERHRDDAGHGRFEIVLGQAAVGAD